MPVTIREVTSEVALEVEDDRQDAQPIDPGQLDDPTVDALVRRVTRHVLERLSLEWGR